ncbi:MAG: isoprenyl transferase [Candidatus Cloacimonetes bacterium HGW-Cloacimonetes-3]|jgi:undecaprenyl diphosphate synthase|nr:MAG: isoprenyl transferase [Candidatus Cloacimonetes bacterium HGW-Cloacimonetes-3]
MAKQNYKELIPLLNRDRLPKHIGIIMDGNGRWAKQRNRPHLFGHRAGAKSIREVVELGVELGIGYLTFYTFSTENWNRPADEVKGLLKMLKERLAKEIPDLDKQNIYVQFIGTSQGLDPEYWAEVQSIAATTHTNTGMVLNIAFNYGGRLEVIEGIKKLATEKSIAEIAELSPEKFSDYLWTKGQPDPDLIIRTSGEMRLSNFLLWQSAYSELYITDTLWPDFTKAEMIKALLDYQNRERRFGGRKK